MVTLVCAGMVFELDANVVLLFFKLFQLLVIVCLSNSPVLASKLKDLHSLNASINDKISNNVRRSYASVDAFDHFYLIIQKRWEKIEIIQKELGLNLLKKDSIGYCDKCHAFRQAEGLGGAKNGASSKCFLCQRTIVSNKRYFSLPETTAQYISGVLLEDYVSKMLEGLGWITETNIYIFGTSGVRFEIDILATKQGKTLSVECKSGSTGLNNLSSFMAKFYDIKTDQALFLSLPKVNQEMKNMVKRRRDVLIIDDVKGDRDLENRLKKL